MIRLCPNLSDSLPPKKLPKRYPPVPAIAKVPATVAEYPNLSVNSKTRKGRIKLPIPKIILATAK
ncbi:hypothetical protein VSWAT3_19173 [Vibrionales bacterium SWAT-3]|nr:hypothetical protein VSWAT3_19173 [Vibrionales bacterium SWAT-3]